MGLQILEELQQLKCYLLERANIHGMKYVLRIIWMLFKRNGFLEGFSLDDKDNGKEGDHGGKNCLHSLPLNQAWTCYQHATESHWKEKEKNSWGRNHEGVLLVVYLITQLKVFLCMEAAWGERDDKRGWSWKRVRGAAVSSPPASWFLAMAGPIFAQCLWSLVLLLEVSCTCRSTVYHAGLICRPVAS